MQIKPLTLAFLAFITLISLFSCTTKRSILNRNYEVNVIQINAGIADFEIIDSRKNVNPNPIRIPTVSFPGQKIESKPALTVEQKGLMEQKIRSYFIDSLPQYNITVSVQEGLQRFSATFFNEIEYVQVDLKCELRDPNTDALLINCNSSAFFEGKSMDASNKFMDKLYNKAVNTAIYKCFEQIQPFEN